MTPEVELFVRGFVRKLIGFRDIGLRKTNVKCTDISLMTDLSYNGFPLRKIMIPHLQNIDVHLAQVAFDAYMYPMLEGGEADLATLRDFMEGAQYQELSRFMRLSKSFEEGVVRLLACLGCSSGAEITFDNKSIVLSRDDVSFGVENGVVRSRFCSGLQLHLDPKSVLHSEGFRQTSSRWYHVMRGELRKKGGESALNVLAALDKAEPKLNLGDLTQRVAREMRLTVGLERRINKALDERYDPYDKLWGLLVPHILTRGQFSKLVTQYDKRNITPTFEMRQKVANRLFDFLHKNKEYKS